MYEWLTQAWDWLQVFIMSSKKKGRALAWNWRSPWNLTDPGGPVVSLPLVRDRRYSRVGAGHRAVLC